MNAVTSFSAATTREPFDEAHRRVHEWRGRCIDALSRAEDAVTKCLVALAEVPDRGSSVRLEHLIGQRYEALAQVIGAGGPFAAEGRAAHAALQTMRAHASFRNEICHGVAKVALDRSDRWLLVLRKTTLRANRMALDIVVLEELEAEQQLDDVVRASRALCSMLGQLRKLVEPRAAQPIAK